MTTKTQQAIDNSQSLFQYKVKSVTDGMGKTEKVIKKSTNAKLGKRVTKGRLKGMPIYTVTLEERKTCPSTCAHWKDCYGNNMHLATRYTYDGALLNAMSNELHELQKKHPKGFLVRLHVLGDFPDMPYVHFWGAALRRFPALHVYGYTAHHKGTPLGDMISSMVSPRFMVRESGAFKEAHMTAVSYDNPTAQGMLLYKQAFICPVQEDKVSDCGACGLCWTSEKPVVFKTH